MTGEYKGLQRVTRAYRGLQGLTGNNTGLHGIKKGKVRLERLQGLQGVTKGN